MAVVGRTTIVDIEEIIDNDTIVNEAVRLLDLCFINWCKIDILKWFARRKLIKNSYRCAVCDMDASLTKRADISDGYQWHCRICTMRKTIRDGSFFASSRLSLQQLIVAIYCWAWDYPQSAIAQEASIASPTTIVDWCSFCREICEVHLENNPSIIGGFDEDGQPKVVEIDESKFFHRKYHRGQWRPGHWVFGGIERDSGKCFLVEVPNRTEETLSDVIRQYILPGSIIVSDGWRSYHNLGQLDGGIYMHEVIVHEHNFVDPNNRDIHTQNVENLWMRVKRKIRRQFGTSDTLFPSYLHEFIWRNLFPRQRRFQNFLVCVRGQYQFE